MSSELQFVSKRGYQCDAGWHLRSYGLQLVVYNKIGAVTWAGKQDGIPTYREYSDEIGDMADFFYNSASKGQYQAMWEAFDQLRKKGWLKQLPATKRIAALEEGEERPGVKHDLKATRFRWKNYLYIPHDEWAAEHPGQCYVDPEAAPWHGNEYDKLAAQLRRMSGGKLKWPEPLMVRLRTACQPDEAIADKFQDLIDRQKEQPRTERDWKTLRREFIGRIKATT